MTLNDVVDSLTKKYGQPGSGSTRGGALILVWGSSWPAIYLSDVSFNIPSDRLEVVILESSYTLTLVSRGLEKEAEGCRKKVDNVEREAAKEKIKF